MCEKHTHRERQTNRVFEKNRQEVRDTDRQKQRLCENATKRKIQTYKVCEKNKRRDRETKFVRKTYTHTEIERERV
jgi:hypothetical protein